MRTLTAYEISSGRTAYTVTVPDSDATLQSAPQGFGWIDGEVDFETQYVSGGTVVDRPTMGYTRDDNSFTNLPDPVGVNISGPVNDNFECTGGTLQLTFTEPGEYTVKFSRFPYIDAEAVIHAT